MPKFARTKQCVDEWANLTPEQRDLFRAALKEFLEDLPKRQFRPGLRVKGVRAAKGVFEMTWECHNGRATFQYGDTKKGEPDVIWRRIGTHDILREP